MLAIVGGLGAAVVFAAVTLSNSRSSRMIGPGALLGWIMLIGLAVTAPFAVVDGLPEGLEEGGSAAWLAVAGVGNVVGLLLAYAALGRGKVGIVAPMVSAQGAVAAVVSVLAGEAISASVAVTLGVIVCGITLAAITPAEREESEQRHEGRATLYALGAALAIGLSLYAIARASLELSVAWALLPSRLVGVAAVTVPLALRSQLTLTREALALVLFAGVFEVVGFALFAFGSRHGIAVSAVLASQFAAIAAVAAYVLFRERLSAVQVGGVVILVAGVGTLSGLQA